ncbi:MAG: hypothetical protein ACFFED_11715 [Candidatus Thorarchaeota archaeon]
MELTISLLITGIIILVATSWRARNIRLYKNLQSKLEEEFDTRTLDMTGAVEYTNCRSYEWVYENVTKNKPNKFGGFLQRYLMDNTLYAGAFLALLVGLAGIMIGFIFIVSIITTGTAIAILLIGILVIIGPGNPKSSEDLLNELRSNDFSALNREDYVYVSIAVKSIVQWIAIAFLIGFVFVSISPWGEMLPETAALLVALFSEQVLWNPALFLSEFFVPAAILYLFFVPTFILVIIPSIIYRRLKQRSR